ncbi:MAG: ATP-binding protein [Sphingopyxis sp.]
MVIWFSPHPANDATDTLRFETAEFRYHEARQIPTTGWQRAPLPFHDFFAAPTAAARNGAVLWIKLRFNTAELPPGRLAFFTDYTPERYLIFLNGEEIFRNYSDPAARRFASFEPAFVPLPRDSLNVGRNEIVLRLESETSGSLGLGNTALGDERLIRDKHDLAYALQFLGPQIINGILASLTISIFLFWFKRREEKSFFWLTLVGIIWWTRNLHYSATDPAIGAAAMWSMVSISIFLLTIAFFCFTVTALDVRNRIRWIWFSVAGGLALILIREALLLSGHSDFLAFAFVAPFTLLLSIIFFIAIVRQPSAENLTMFVAITIAILLSFHDMMFLGNAWQGAGFQLQPYASVVVFSAFAFSLGRRVLLAFDTTENLSTQLEASVAHIRKELAESETERRRLEVLTAVEQERTRLMREIHDGIGSNLITALAVAQNQEGGGQTVDTLKHSIADLRAAIDSLEPTEGELTLLLASFRYRMEPELKKAGIGLRWHVDILPPFEWLEATNALHILRMFQEIVANCIKHAGASEIAVNCVAENRDGRAGICIEFLDNGTGITSDTVLEGNGIANMKARCAAVLGEIDIGCRRDRQGTRVAIWLPYDRRAVSRPALGVP